MDQTNGKETGMHSTDTQAALKKSMNLYTLDRIKIGKQKCRLPAVFMLFIVGVAMDTVQQVESQLIMRHYDGFMRKVRIRGRRS